MQGTGASSAQQAVGQQHSELNSVSDLCVVSASRPEGIAQVGQRRLSHSEVDSLIDLLEVIELEHQDDHFLSSYAQALRENLIALQRRSQA